MYQYERFRDKANPIFLFERKFGKIRYFIYTSTNMSVQSMVTSNKLQIFHAKHTRHTVDYSEEGLN